jgi:hypothetical protein
VGQDTQEALGLSDIVAADGPKSVWLAGVHRTTVTETPRNARLQGFLREALRALSAAYEVTQDRDRSIFWFRNTPIPEFGHRTAETPSERLQR